ncbi:MAG: ferritin family protein [Chloroflexota bacterium]
MAIFKAADVIELALELEKSGEVFYRAVAEKSKNPQVKALFEDLAQQEVYHYQAFQQLGNTVWDTPFIAPDSWQEYLGYLQATVQSAFFQGQGKALSEAESVQDEKEAIRMAIGFEKETLLFFHDLKDMVPPGEIDTVNRIINEEKAHLRRLAAML